MGTTFRYLLIKSDGTLPCNLRQVQVWLGNINIASVSNGASEALWSKSDWISYKHRSFNWDDDLAEASLQDDASFEYLGTKNNAKYANDDSLTSPAGSIYQYAHSEIDHFTDYSFCIV